MIDEIDRKIIIRLQQDGRASYVELAHELGISSATVYRRVERLKKDGIMRIMAVPDPAKLGHSAYAIIALDVDMNKVDEVLEKIGNHHAVYFECMMFGRFDVLVTAYFPSAEELASFVKDELSHVDGIKQSETFYVSRIVKRNFGWLREDTPLS